MTLRRKTNDSTHNLQPRPSFDECGHVAMGGKSLQLKSSHDSDSNYAVFHRETARAHRAALLQVRSKSSGAALSATRSTGATSAALAAFAPLPALRRSRATFCRFRFHHAEEAASCRRSLGSPCSSRPSPLRMSSLLVCSTRCDPWSPASDPPGLRCVGGASWLANQARGGICRQIAELQISAVKIFGSIGVENSFVQSRSTPSRSAQPSRSASSQSAPTAPTNMASAPSTIGSTASRKPPCPSRCVSSATSIRNDRRAA